MIPVRENSEVVMIYPNCWVEQVEDMAKIYNKGLICTDLVSQIHTQIGNYWLTSPMDMGENCISSNIPNKTQILQVT